MRINYPVWAAKVQVSYLLPTLILWTICICIIHNDCNKDKVSNLRGSWKAEALGDHDTDNITRNNRWTEKATILFCDVLTFPNILEGKKAEHRIFVVILLTLNISIIVSSERRKIVYKTDGIHRVRLEQSRY